MVDIRSDREHDCALTLIVPGDSEA
ncbi:protein of unknown function (plasmid) [Cupriavidus taiwanensis]|uniref:Uncharacterized protein n=1 Tax=Cupriavidus taiwanensis TaxID=164546 RepID=A0A375INJ8_9BURK|nr:protein of unknown function [Cupriavidus taiwanensis]